MCLIAHLGVAPWGYWHNHHVAGEKSLRPLPDPVQLLQPVQNTMAGEVAGRGYSESKIFITLIACSRLKHSRWEWSETEDSEVVLLHQLPQKSCLIGANTWLFLGFDDGFSLLHPSTDTVYLKCGFSPLWGFQGLFYLYSIISIIWRCSWARLC